MEHTDFYKGLNLAITVSDRKGEVIYQNDSSLEVNGDARGRNLQQCHNERSWQMIRHMMATGTTNAYTISKNGVRKMIFQSPWKCDGEVAGMVELSMIIPEEMPHYQR